MTKGRLIYDSSEDRLAVAPEISYLRYDYDDLRHLHCGDVIEAYREIITDKTTPVWIPTRVEKGVSEDPDLVEWYLVDLYKMGEIPLDLIVRTSR